MRALYDHNHTERSLDELLSRIAARQHGLLTRAQARGLPLPMLQYVVTDDDRFVARLDFAYPDHRVAIEVDGFRHHDTRSTFDDERARWNDIEALGWRVLRVTAAHLERDPGEVVAWIERAIS